MESCTDWKILEESVVLTLSAAGSVMGDGEVEGDSVGIEETDCNVGVCALGLVLG